MLLTVLEGDQGLELSSDESVLMSLSWRCVWGKLMGPGLSFLICEMGMPTVPLTGLLG